MIGMFFVVNAMIFSYFSHQSGFLILKKSRKSNLLHKKTTYSFWEKGPSSDVIPTLEFFIIKYQSEK